MVKLIASVFLELVRSWEFILAAGFLTIAIPLIFYAASFQPRKMDISITEKVRKVKAKLKQKDTSAEDDPEDDE